MSNVGLTVEQLRAAFDENFARAPIDAPPSADMLVIGVGGTVRVLRLEQIARVVRNPGTVTVPAHSEAFVGIAGLRGAVLPVFSLAEMLAMEKGEEGWLLIVAATSQHDEIAFACDEIRGYIRVPIPASRAEVVQVGADSYSVIDLSALRARLENATRSKDDNGQ